MPLSPLDRSRVFSIVVRDEATGQRSNVIATATAVDDRQVKVCFDRDGRAYRPRGGQGLLLIRVPEYDLEQES
jgi:hypothetical protein